MSQPGWYPDPGGTPGGYRYWDGGGWSSEVRGGPGGTNPDGPTGTTPLVPGTNPDGPTGTTPRPAGATRGVSPGSGAAALGAATPGPASAPRRPDDGRRRAAVVATGIVVALALLIGAVLVVPRLWSAGDPASGPVNSSRPTISSWDERTSPTPRATPTPTPTPTSTGTFLQPRPCPTNTQAVRGGRLYGGMLSVATITDPRWGPAPVAGAFWAICATGVERAIEGSWTSNVILATVSPSSTSRTLREQAEQIADDSASTFYSRGTTGVEEVASKAVTVDGFPGWQLRRRVLVGDYGPTIPGDVMDIIVVEVGTQRSVLLTFATIGDTQTQKLVDESRRTLRVER